jgi:hypothetical protein
MLIDPDGYQIELVQWPVGHTDGMTAADFTKKHLRPANYANRPRSP